MQSLSEAAKPVELDLVKPVPRHGKKIQIPLHDMRRLDPGRWLNDEVVNAYCALLDASTEDNILILHSFFVSHLTTLSKQNFANRHLLKVYILYSYSRNKILMVRSCRSRHQTDSSPARYQRLYFRYLSR